MREIKDRNLFGLTLKQMEGEENMVKIIEKDGSETLGRVTAYTAGGYEVKNEIIPAAVQIQNDQGLLRVIIDNIKQINIE